MYDPRQHWGGAKGDALSAADREAFLQKLQADPAWATFQAVMVDKTQPVSNTMYRTLQRWGEISDGDMIWRTHSFAVEDPPAFLAAVDKFMSSETGKKFPGQVFLSAVLSGGLTPVTHVISVGQVSEAAIEDWEQEIQGNSDWTSYLAQSRSVSKYLGNELIRTVQTWGKSLDDATQ